MPTLDLGKPNALSRCWIYRLQGVANALVINLVHLCAGYQKKQIFSPSQSAIDFLSRIPTPPIGGQHTMFPIVWTIGGTSIKLPPPPSPEAEFEWVINEGDAATHQMNKSTVAHVRGAGDKFGEMFDQDLRDKLACKINPMNTTDNYLEESAAALPMFDPIARVRPWTITRFWEQVMAANVLGLAQLYVQDLSARTW